MEWRHSKRETPGCGCAACGCATLGVCRAAECHGCDRLRLAGEDVWTGGVHFGGVQPRVAFQTLCTLLWWNTRQAHCYVRMVRSVAAGWPSSSQGSCWSNDSVKRRCQGDTLHAGMLAMGRATKLYGCANHIIVSHTPALHRHVNATLWGDQGCTTGVTSRDTSCSARLHMHTCDLTLLPNRASMHQLPTDKMVPILSACTSMLTWVTFDKGK